MRGADWRGVEGKLARANECIYNLDAEITAFLKAPKGVRAENQEKALHEFLKHARREVPLRFGVLAGEIVHHLRSIFDHLIWQVSIPESRMRKRASLIAFPVCIEPPTSKDDISKHGGKIAGVGSNRALKLIRELQPCQTPDPLNHPLTILHDLDCMDKHKTLVLVESKYAGSLSIPLSHFTQTMIMPGVDYKKIAESAAANKLKIELSLYVAFAKFGQGENEPVIPSLQHLSDFTRDAIRRFSEL